MNAKHKDRNGFTLAELLVATLVLALVLVGLLQVFIRTSMLTNMARDKTAAMIEAIAKMEEVRNYTFEDIIADYDETVFALTNLDGYGYVYATALQTGLLEVEVVIGWEDRYGQIFGEDADNAGDFDDSSEDADGNGKMSSSITLISKVFDRT